MRPGPTARAAAVLVVFLALFVAVDRLSGQRSPRSVSASGSSGVVTATTSRPAPTTTRAPTTAPSTSAPATTVTTTSQPTGATGTTLRSPRGVTVQVLNGAFVSGLAHRVAERIRAAGYDVVAVNTAFGNYLVSRIYYTDGHKADAEAFRARFPAFKTILPASQAQAGLSRKVALHAVIGQNYKEI